MKPSFISTEIYPITYAARKIISTLNSIVYISYYLYMSVVKGSKDLLGIRLSHILMILQIRAVFQIIGKLGQRLEEPLNT